MVSFFSLIVSKDKYADQTVWDMMALLEVLAYPTVVCINKAPEQSGPILIESFLEKWKSIRNDAAPMIRTLSYRNQEDLAQTPDQELSLLDYDRRASESSHTGGHFRADTSR